MYVWEMLAQRLRHDGWEVGHRQECVDDGIRYVVVLHGLGQSYRATGPTLSDAFARAARIAREHPLRSSSHPAAHVRGPHFGRSMARVAQ